MADAFKNVLEREVENRKNGKRLDQEFLDNLNRQIKELIERDEKRNKECND
jgi:hypothetical protein